MESSQTGSCIHDKIHQYPSRRIQDFFLGKIGAVALIYRSHNLFGYFFELPCAAIVIVYHTSSRLCLTLDDEAILEVCRTDSLQLTFVMVEGHPHSGVKRKIGSNIIGGQIDFAVLHVLRVHELDLIDHVQFLE